MCMARWQGMQQAAGTHVEGENGAPVIDTAELLAAVDRLTQNGEQTFAIFSSERFALVNSIWAGQTGPVVFRLLLQSRYGIGQP